MSVVRFRTANVLAVACAGVVLVVASQSLGGARDVQVEPGRNAVEAVTSTGASAPASLDEEIPVQGQSALAVLSALVVSDEPGQQGYERDLFGYRAVDLDRNGCDIRNDILSRDLTNTTIKTGCVVLSGTLDDPYTGQTVAFVRGDSSAQIHLDHVVSLSNAWSSGASGWDTQTRQQFGNDPLNLLAVVGAANLRKGDSAADQWLPRTEYQCEYVARQVAVKYVYGLTVTDSEQATMTVVLETCPSQALPEEVTGK